MKGVLICSTLLIIYLSLINCLDCPDSASLGECKCYANVQTIQCYNVSEIKLDINSPFKALIINLSRMKNISAEDFGNATFETITINNNAYLEYIDYKIFQNNIALKSVTISHNPKLGPRLLEIGKYLAAATESIAFVDNGIVKIPDYAFKPESGHDARLKFIYLNNNTISSVGAYAFDGLARVEEIRLDHNLITKLDTHSLYINTDPITRYVDINLSHNSLNLTNPIIVNDKWITDLYMEYNGLKTLPQSVFQTFFENYRNKLHANGNPFICECNSMKWILSDIFNPNIIHVKCSNMNDMDIVSVTVDQLCPKTK